MYRYLLIIFAVVTAVVLSGCSENQNLGAEAATPATAGNAPERSGGQVKSAEYSAPAGRRMLAEDFSADQRNGTTVVYFAKVACPSCKRQDAIWQKAIKKLPAGVKADKRFTYAVNYRAYGVTQLPTLIFYRDGVEVSRSIGVTDENRIIAAAKRAM